MTSSCTGHHYINKIFLIITCIILCIRQRASILKIFPKTIMISSKILLGSIAFKFVAMIIGVLGNVTVIIYAIFVSKERKATSYLVANLALADLLVCLTFYPIWIIEFTQTILDIDSDQDLFCKLSRPASFALLFASVASLFAITFDRYLYIGKPLRYPLIVTKRRVFRAIAGIWLISFCLFAVYGIHYTMSSKRMRSLCYVPLYLAEAMQICFHYIPITFIFILNFRIFFMARKQRKRISAETSTPDTNQSHSRSVAIRRLFQALKVVKTFFMVSIVLAFCCFVPSVLGAVQTRYDICSASCKAIWYLVLQYELYGINSIVNAFIYGLRHLKQRKAYGQILSKILRCKKLTA